MTMESETTLPLAAMERIMRNAGAQRVSSEAVKLLQESTHSLGEELAEDAVQLARSSGDSTVDVDHVKRAVSGE